MTTTPVLPYAGSSGWSGSSTSKARADHDDAIGKTSTRQRQVLTRLLSEGHLGLTWRELAGPEGWHHGQASGTLSVLHRAGIICRLTETRVRSKVYVHPTFVNGRPTEPFVVKRRVTVPDGAVPVFLPPDVVALFGSKGIYQKLQALGIHRLDHKSPEYLMFLHVVISCREAIEHDHPAGLLA